MATRMVTDRRRSADTVATKLTGHAPQIGRQLTSLAKKHLRRGEAMPEFSLAVDLLGRILQSASETMTQADDAHEEESRDDAAPRAARNASIDALRGQIKALREIVTGVYGASALALCGLDGETPSEPAALERYATAVAKTVRAAKLPAPRVKGADFDRAAFADGLDAERKQLASHRADVSREEQELSATQVAKDRAVEQYDKIFSAVANASVGLLQLVGEPELASRLRPSTRRPGRTIAEEPEGDPEAPKEPATPAALIATPAGEAERTPAPVVVATPKAAKAPATPVAAKKKAAKRSRRG